MATVQIEPNLDIKTDKILSGIAQLSRGDLEDFLVQVSGILARKKASNLPKRESELLLIINKSWSEKKETRFRDLIEKLQTETISSTEHNEYLNLVDERQDRSIKRLKSLIELAAIRKTSVAELSKQLDIKTPN